MEDVKKYIDFSYLVAFVLIAWLSMKMMDGIWRLIHGLPNPELLGLVSLSGVLGVLAAAGLTLYLRANPRIYSVVTECGVELKKTIWPGWDETKSNTLVVISTTFFLGFLLWFFDLFWKTATDLLYP